MPTKVVLRWGISYVTPNRVWRRAGVKSLKDHHMRRLTCSQGVETTQITRWTQNKGGKSKSLRHVDQTDINY